MSANLHLFTRPRHSTDPSRSRTSDSSKRNRHYRVRHDRVDAGGTVTLRYRSRLRHIAVGRANKGRRVVLLIADRDVRVLSAEGEILRQLTLDPSRKYQPLG